MAPELPEAEYEQLPACRLTLATIPPPRVRGKRPATMDEILQIVYLRIAARRFS